MVREGGRQVIVASRGANRRVVRWSSRATGDFQMSARDHGRLERHDHFWALVDLTGPWPEVHVLPEDDVRAFLASTYAAYLARFGGHRARNDDSTHQKINTRELRSIVARSVGW